MWLFEHYCSLIQFYFHCIHTIMQHVYSCSPLSSKLVGRRCSSTSPLCHSDKLLLSTDQKSNEKGRTPSRTKNEDIDKDFFEVSVLSFIESLNLQDRDLDSIRVTELQEELEQVQGRELSPQERHMFIAVVKKYVMSLRYKKSSNTKPTHLNQSSKTEHSSNKDSLKPKEIDASLNMPHHGNTVKTDQISMKKCDGNNRGDDTGWLCTEGDYCSMQASTSKTSSHFMNPSAASRESTEESLVKCPVCGSELTLQIFKLVFIYKLLPGQAVVRFFFVKG